MSQFKIKTESIASIQRLKAKLELAEKEIYGSPFFYRKWVTAKNNYNKAIKTSLGKQTKLFL